MTAEAKAAEIARLRQEIESQQARLEARPRRKFIAANTRELEYRAYMDDWVARIEQVGNLNFPDVARHNKSTADLVLSVAVKRDGSVEGVEIVKTSGQRELDDAAMKLVRLAAPFEPLPETKQDIDVLHITRTWQFMPGDSVKAQARGP